MSPASVCTTARRTGVLTPYLIDHGVRYFPGPRVPGGISGKVLQTRLPVVIHTEEELNRVSAETGSDSNLGGDDIDRSFVYAPLVSGDVATGIIVIGKQAEHAFSDSDVSLITTVAASLSVALQNAQSFEAERQRNAELAVINSIQQGMAGSLDFQGIIDMVGDKLREVLQTEDIGISWYDQETRLAQPSTSTSTAERLFHRPHSLRPGGPGERMLADPPAGGPEHGGGNARDRRRGDSRDRHGKVRGLGAHHRQRPRPGRGAASRITSASTRTASPK